MRMKIALIVAMSANGVIGRNGEIPWHHKEDLRFFKKVTKQFPVIMGRKTFESILKKLGGPLPERTNIVITNNKLYIAKEIAKGCEVANSFEDAVRIAEETGAEKAFVIGGAQIYEKALPHADLLFVTIINVWLLLDGDTYFPGYENITSDPIHVAEWNTISQQMIPAKNNTPSCVFFYYERKKYVDIGNAREEEQRKTMLDILKNKECPFCLKNLFRYHKEPVIAETEHWMLTRNQWPYPHTQHHFLAIYKTHAEKLNEIKLEAFSDLLELFQTIEEEFSLPGGALCLRFGETDYSAGTVRHIHAQLIVPNINARDYKRIQFAIGKKTDKNQ